MRLSQRDLAMIDFLYQVWCSTPIGISNKVGKRLGVNNLRDTPQFLNKAYESCGKDPEKDGDYTAAK